METHTTIRTLIVLITFSLFVYNIKSCHETLAKVERIREIEERPDGTRTYLFNDN